MTSLRIAALGAIAILSLAMGGCGKGRELAYAKVQLAEQERQIAELEAQIAAKDAEIASLRANPGSPAAPAPAPIAKGGPDDQVFGAELSTRDREIVISIRNDVLFKPGSAVLSDQAKRTLDETIALIRNKYPNHYVRVEGHTDNQQVRRSRDKWEDNWDLSGGRGQSVLHYLLDHGLPAKNLGFAGYGMERPVSSNNSPAGQAKNRRVEIVVIPKSGNSRGTGE